MQNRPNLKMFRSSPKVLLGSLLFASFVAAFAFVSEKRSLAAEFGKDALGVGLSLQQQLERLDLMFNALEGFVQSQESISENSFSHFVTHLSKLRASVLGIGLKMTSADGKTVREFFAPKLAFKEEHQGSDPVFTLTRRVAFSPLSSPLNSPLAAKEVLVPSEASLVAKVNLLNLVESALTQFQLPGFSVQIEGLESASVLKNNTQDFDSRPLRFDWTGSRWEWLQSAQNSEPDEIARGSPFLLAGQELRLRMTLTRAPGLRTYQLEAAFAFLVSFLVALVTASFSWNRLFSSIEFESKAKWTHRLALVQKQNDDFLSFLAHELRGSMTPLMGWIAILKMQISEDSSGRKPLAHIEKGANNHIKLIDKIFDISRVNASEIVVNLEEIDLSEVILRALGSEQVSRAAENKKVTLRSIDVRETGTVLWADPTRLTQGISEFLLESIDRSVSGGEVRVSLSMLSQELKLVIEDDGLESFSQAPQVNENGPIGFDAQRGFGKGPGVGPMLARAFFALFGAQIINSALENGTGRRCVCVFKIKHVNFTG